MKLHQFELSPYCDKVRRILYWKGIDYEIEEYPLNSRKKIQALCAGAGKLPCLEHEGQFISDSTDIALFLEREFPNKNLLPSDPVLRGQTLILEDWADETLYFFEMFYRFTLPHNGQHNIPRLLEHDSKLFKRLAKSAIPRHMRKMIDTQGLGRKPIKQIENDLKRHIQAVGDLLAKKADASQGNKQEDNWLVGNALTLADISVYSQFICIGDSVEGQAMLQANSAVETWMRRVEAATGPKPRGSL